jgi:hypothetical protein
MSVQSSIGTKVRIATAQLSAKNITAITKANPCVVTSATHGLAVGTVVVFASIGGMTQLNSRAAVITAQDTNTFTLGGIDSTNYTTYTSGGTATPQTMTQVVKCKGWTRSGAAQGEIDATAMDDISVVRLSGMPDRGSVTVPVVIDTTDPGQKAMRDACGGAAVAMTVTLPDLKASAVMVSWQNFTDELTTQAPHQGEFTGYVSGDYSWYA